MLTLLFVFRTLIDFYVLLLLLRVWLQSTTRDRYNPFYQLVFQWTQPVVRSLHRLMPQGLRFDLAALFLAYILLTLRTPILLLLQNQHALGPTPPLYLLIGVLALLKCSGKLLFWVLLLRALCSWSKQGVQPLEYTLQQLTEPLLKPIRRRLPVATQGLDFSIMALLLLLITLDYLGSDLFGLLWSYS